MPKVEWDELQFPSDDKQFSMELHNLGDLEIRDPDNGRPLFYFYDRTRRRLITDFVLDDKARVRLLCNVLLIKTEDGFTPRLKLWKQDKTKSGLKVLQEEIPNLVETRSIKASVDASDGHENLWKLIFFLQSVRDIAVPESAFSVVDSNRVELLDLLQSEDKATVVDAIRVAIGNDLTEQDIAIMANRKQQLGRFERLLFEDGYFKSEKVRLNLKSEALWQNFFESNRWIFGYGLNLVAMEGLDDGKLERITAGANVFTGAGKRSDAVLRSRGYISSLLFCEIKTHEKDLIKYDPYRRPDVYGPSDELAGGIAQVQKTTRKALRILASQIHKLFEADGSATDISFSTSRPRQAVIIGNLARLQNDFGPNGEQVESFELFRSSITDTEIITFDELYQRAQFIVHD